MSDSNPQNHENASLSQFKNNRSHDSEIETTSKDDKNSSCTPQDSGVIDVKELTDPYLTALINELSTDKITSIINTFSEDNDILYNVKTATSNEQLANNIRTLEQHTADRPSLVEPAADMVAEELGCRPFSVTLTDPESDLQSPMIYLEVNDDVTLTNNPILNAELLEHVVDTTAETQSEQQNLFEQWCTAIGEESIVAFKTEQNPDALGFTIPTQIPATNDVASHTPITDIKYIGNNTAQEIHPCNEIMTIEDLSSLTDKQWEWISLPVDNRSYTKQVTRTLVGAVAKHVSENTTFVLGQVLAMKDRRDSSDTMDWVNPSNAFGITSDDSIYIDNDVSPVASTQSNDEGVIVTTERNSQTTYKTVYWDILESISNNSNETVYAGENGPLIVELQDCGFVVAAPLK